jgi:hypothetical protein
MVKMLCNISILWYSAPAQFPMYGVAEAFKSSWMFMLNFLMDLFEFLASIICDLNHSEKC